MHACSAFIFIIITSLLILSLKYTDKINKRFTVFVPRTFKVRSTNPSEPGEVVSFRMTH